MHKIYWDANAQPIGASVAEVIYHLRADDSDDLLMDSVSVEDFELDATEVYAYDALDVEFRLLERKMNVMRRIMNRADADLKVREDNGPDDMGVNITKPFKRNGTQNIAVIFQLTDGQTVTIVLHNPDLDPGNIKPDDHLLSWKWMINKKDVTIAVAPEKGKDLNVNEVARRIMRLASKNSAAFARANARRAERIANIEKQKSDISDAEKELAQIESDISAAQVENEELVEQLSNKQKELKQAQDAAAERGKKAEEERKKAEEEAARKAEEERQKAEEEAKRAAEEEAKRKAEEEQKKAQKPAESWETRPLDTLADVVKFIDDESGWWNPAKPAAQRLLEAVKRLGYTSFKGVDGEGSNVEFRQQDDGLWNRTLNGLDTGAEKGYWTSAMYTLSKAFKNGSLAAIDAPDKPAAPGTTVNEMEAEAKAVQQEEQQNADPQWEADKAYCERVINGELSQMGEVSAVIDQIMDIWDRADASGIAERSQLAEQAYNLIEKAALEAGMAAAK